MTLAKNRGRAIMIAATKEHTGKTSVSMALLSGLISRFGVEKIGYMKPVGQKWVPVHKNGSAESFRVDKDVKVAHDHWGLTCDFEDMSPLVIDSGYTRRFLEGDIDRAAQDKKILQGFENIISQKDLVIVEGTGHTGVGSIVGMNNANVARILGIDIILVANGGIGSTFDQLEVNRQLCISEGIKVAGAVVNKVRMNNCDEIKRNLKIALAPWNIPVLGIVPDAYDLDLPAITDLEILFSTRAFNKERIRYQPTRRFKKFELITASLRHLMELLGESSRDYTETCFITHASRQDIILGLLSHAAEQRYGLRPFLGGLILTGTPPGNIPDNYLQEYIHNSFMPVLSVDMSTTECLSKLKDFTPKMNAADKDRTSSVVKHYEPYIDFDALLKLMQ